MFADKLELLYFIIPLGSMVFIAIYHQNYNITAKLSILFIFVCAVVSTFKPTLADSLHHVIVVASSLSLLKNNQSTIDFN